MTVTLKLKAQVGEVYETNAPCDVQEVVLIVGPPSLAGTFETRTTPTVTTCALACSSSRVIVTTRARSS